jgi:formamidopyrimidine-DNA glycosylase
MTRIMPELPEVEFARRSLVRWFDGHALVAAEADPKARTFRGADPKAFEALKGTLLRADRRGKYLMLAFSEGEGVIAHLGMTGKFLRTAAGVEVPYSRARFVLDTGQVIHFRDPRLFGRLEPMANEALARNEVISALGVDPIVDGLSVEQLQRALGSSKQQLKVAMMDQGRIAGLGNIHAAEALYRAKLHPARLPASLTPAEWTRLQAGIMASLHFALETTQGLEEIEYVEEPGTKNPFLVYGREGEPCKRCRTPIESLDQGGRTSYYCPHCQPLGGVAKAKKKPATPKRAGAKKKPAVKSKARRS